MIFILELLELLEQMEVLERLKPLQVLNKFHALVSPVFSKLAFVMVEQGNNVCFVLKYCSSSPKYFV